jgi:hypothetical protein
MACDTVDVAIVDPAAQSQVPGRSPVMRLIAIVGICTVILGSVVHAQFTEGTNRKSPQPGIPSPAIGLMTAPSVPALSAPLKKPGHYTVQEWRALIDSLWGLGPPTSTKLEVFDYFWNLIDKQYAGFPYLTVNWDSLKAVYRPQIEAGVSRGRLWGIIGHMYLSLQEVHTWMSDLDLDSYFLDGGNPVYRPGMPVFFPSGWGWAGSFGAALTPQPDSSLLVYRAVNPHPLGIVAGDVILGYDRIPWKRLYPELLAVQFPVEWWGETGYGSSPRSRVHGLLNSAGSNWGLFDTVDVVKRATGDTVHLPTAPLAALNYTALFATEQVAVPGIAMPDYRSGVHHTWGIVEGTTIGYVYVYRWNSVDGPTFAAAIRDLIDVKKVTGLILDFRYNLGSDDSWIAANTGLDRLFNEDPAGPSRWQSATRSNPADHFGFSYSAPPGSFPPDPDFYDRPIAVLTGPQTWSLGEHVAFRMRSHPMVRFFGLPTNGAFVVGGGGPAPVFGNWYYRYAGGQMRSLVNNEGFLMHKSFPVDEEVWLTGDGVARGEDDVVKRALGWINTLSYAHDVQLRQVSKDSVEVIGRVTNPLSHTISVVVTLRDGSGAMLDSVTLAADTVWNHRFVPSADGTIRATVRTYDVNAGTSRTLSNVAELVFSRGPSITMDTHSVDLGDIGTGLPRYDTSFVVRNSGYSSDSLTVAVDPVNVSPDTAVFAVPRIFTLVAGDSQRVIFSVLPGLLSPKYYGAQVQVQSWRSFNQPVSVKNYSFRVVITSLAPGFSGIPLAFGIEQNYPNPFNGTTVVGGQWPVASHVRIAVYDILGREVAVLVDEKKEAGRFEMKWDAGNCASGVYVCRMTAGDFVESKKMILMK